MTDSRTVFPIDDDIAIVGLSVHVPGATTLDAYWTNLRDGTESIRRLDEAALLTSGESPARMRLGAYVPAAATLENFDHFDADFFGFSPKEAAILDPQHRQFLEVAWEAMETAGHLPDSVGGKVGVYAGCGMGSYFYFNICSNPDLVDDVGMFLLRHTGNDKDFLSTRVSHVFDLNGPSINLQTACSTSLVAVHYACQALRSGDCDMALAGGATIELPHGRGYLFRENEVLSPDGHCHAFDHRAQGTVFGSGAGVVVLRRLSDALADGDHIWAVIKGSSVNNDGAAKAGYLAPSVSGQANAVAMAHKAAGITAETVDYVECHGTGTYLGDPIEVSALTEAFRRTTDAVGYCRIGSVKSNIGHLDTAAGVASLAKTALALHHREIPPSLGYEAPNPVIDFKTSPFEVNTALTPWVSGTGPRRAGVNSLGVGGTNAHVVLQEAPARPASDASDWPFQVVTVSGRTRAALDANCQALAGHLRDQPDQPLADIAFTLKEGRRGFEYRRVLVAETNIEVAELLDSKDANRVFSHQVVAEDPEVVFMFPGGGAQYPGMARDLYETEPVFRSWMDRGFEALQPKLDYDIRALWLPAKHDQAEAAKKLKQPSAQLPLIMIVEYALAQLWISWGVRPGALVGHSMGENTAACLAGVISFEDCVELVLLRGKLFDTMPGGGMLSVQLSPDDLAPLLGDDLDIAAVNAPDLTTVSGPQAALDAFQDRLAAQDIGFQRILINVAAHSRMLDPILAQFRAFLAGITLKAPQIPLMSNRTGTFITDAQATSPDYWVEHLRHSVRFADCLATLSENRKRIYLEVGPGKTLCALAQMSGTISGNQVLGTLRHPDQITADDAFFVGVFGRLWASGVKADWSQLWGEAKRHRVPLPTYAFQRSRYFIEPGQARAEDPGAALVHRADIAQWGYRPHWQPQLAAFDLASDPDLADVAVQTWLVFSDAQGLGHTVARKLRRAGHTVIEVQAGDTFARLSETSYALAPEQGRSGYDLLLKDLIDRDMAPTGIAHFWLVTEGETYRPGSNFFDHCQQNGFYSLMYLAQAIADENDLAPLHITVVTNGAAQVRSEHLAYPEKATIAGPVGVIPRELPGVTFSTLDIELLGDRPAKAGWLRKSPRHGAQAVNDAKLRLADRLLEDLLAPQAEATLAYRGDKRFELQVRPLALAPQDSGPNRVFRKGGVYLITGGLGGIGLSIAEKLAQDFDARIVLVSRHAMPPQSDWPAYLRNHGPNDTVSRRIRELMRLQTLGADILTVAADVCSQTEMAGALDAARARFGAITGVIHAAGAIDDAPFLAKSALNVEDVLAPKIHGLRVLDALFPDGTLDVLVLFSSTSTVTRPAGQIDYVAANEYLNAYAKCRRGGATRVVALNWGVWAEVGMAADAVAAISGEDTPAPVVPTDMPLLDGATFDAQGNRVFVSQFSTSSRWVLDEHRTLAGDAVMPGTGYLELAAQALQAQGQAGAFSIRDLFFLRPLGIADTETCEVRVRLTHKDDGYVFEVLGGYTLDGRHGFQIFAKAQLTAAADQPGSERRLNIGAIQARMATGPGAANGARRSPQEDHLAFGPRWRVLRKMQIGQGEGLAHLALPIAARGDIAQGYLLHPALMDLATGWAMALIPGYDRKHLWVPASYRRVTVKKALPAEIHSWVRIGDTSGAGDGYAEFDVTICDMDGEVCVEVEGFSMRQLAQPGGFATSRPIDPREVEFDATADRKATASPMAAQLADNVSQGIRPAEGGDALLRAMATGLPQVIVSSLDLDALQLQAAKNGTPEKRSVQTFERPDVGTDYVAPGTDIEKSLAGFWRDLLGVDRVGIEDSFFDLGGHSLIAVRLFSMIKKTYQTDFPISALFEAPTIAKCAAMIAQRTGGDARQNPEAPVGASRLTHLVAMHDGKGGAKAPFFMVAGMFGNVLNLRHLAHHLGSNRPFYGLQARGLLGDVEPHRSIQSAAADCIAELKTVQPKGPYLLGGFSGGGITAYEMAQQLRAQGDEIALLVMLDTPLPVRPTLTRQDKVLIKLQEMRRKGPSYVAQWARARLRWEIQKWVHGAGQAKSDPAQFHDHDIEAAFRTAVAAYDLRPWSGPLSLFRPPLDLHWPVSGGNHVSAAREYVFADNQWAAWAPDLEVVEVPGDHDSMVLEPHVRHMARLLADRIDAAERPRRRPEIQAQTWISATAAE